MHRARTLLVAGAMMAVTCAACIYPPPGQTRKESDSWVPPWWKDKSETAPEPKHLTAADARTLTSDQQLALALGEIYHQTRIMRRAATGELDVDRLETAAFRLRELSKDHTDYWRRIAIARLASAGIERAGVRSAIRILGVDADELRELLAEKKGADEMTRRAMAYEYATRSAPPPPNEEICQSSVPETVASKPKYGEAMVKTKVSIRMTAQELSISANPQNWDNKCAKFAFRDAYLAKKALDKVSFQQTSQCTVNEAPAKPLDVELDDPLYEHFVMPGPSGNSFSNVLHVRTHRSQLSQGIFSVRYDLMNAVCADVDPDHDVMGGLNKDSGHLTSTKAGNWLIVDADKTIGFNPFPHHSPDELADDAYDMLEIMGDAVPLWACCPSDSKVNATKKPGGKKKKSKPKPKAKAAKKD